MALQVTAFIAKVSFIIIFSSFSNIVLTLSKLLTDINECVSESEVCGENAFCVDKNGTHDCICEKGFSKSGDECIGKKISIEKFGFSFETQF